MRAVVHRSDLCHSCPFTVYKLDQYYGGECEREMSFLDPMLCAGKGVVFGELLYSLVTCKLIKVNCKTVNMEL